jgi:adenylate kinase family enzyme
MHSTRIVVIGTSGSGKSTLARALAAKLGLRHIELDALHWDPDWTGVPLSVLRSRVDAALREDGWTVDGNYGQVRDIVWARAQMIVWLDYSFPLVFARALRRTIRRLLTSEQLWNGNQERWSMLFSKESIMLWVIQTHHRRARQYPILLQQPEYAHLKLVRLRTPGEAKLWLETIKPLRNEEALRR